MPSDQGQYLPNDITFQVNHKENAELLDRRGQWTTAMSEKLQLPEWAITENQFDLFDKPQTQRAVVAFNRCALTYIDVDGREAFVARATAFLRILFSFPEFGHTIHVNRIGVRSRFCTQYSGSFEQLLKRTNERYFDLKPGGCIAIGPDARLIDSGASLNFEDQHCKFNTQCGPMKRDQLKSIFFPYKDEKVRNSHTPRYPNGV